MKWTGATLVFLAELGMLAGFAWWGWTVADGVWSVALAVALVAVVAAVWGAFLSPKAPRTLRPPFALLLRIDLLLLGAVAAYAGGARALGIVTAVFALLGTAMTRGLERRVGPHIDAPPPFDLEAR